MHLFCLGITEDCFKAIRDQPFPLPHYFGVGDLPAAQTVLWLAQKLSVKKTAVTVAADLRCVGVAVSC